MLNCIAKIFLLFWLFPCFILGQSGGLPPYKVSRLFNFYFAENFIYDTNIFKTSSNAGQDNDFFLAHTFRIQHGDQRPWYNYDFSYSFMYQNYLNKPELDDSSHNINAQLQIPRKDHSWTFQHQFSISSEPRSLEFDAFLKSYADSSNASMNWRITDDIRFSASASYDIYRYPDFETSDSDRLILNAELAVYILRQVSLSAAPNYQILWRHGFDREDAYNVPVRINFILREPGQQNAELVEWFRQLSISIGYAITEENFDNPLDFSITAAGSLSKQTSWTLNGSRKMEFGLLSSDIQFSTSVSLGVTHRFSQDFNIGFQLGFQRSDYQDRDPLNGITFSLAPSYAITKWVNVQMSYDLQTRFGQKDSDYVTHRFSIGTGIAF